MAWGFSQPFPSPGPGTTQIPSSENVQADAPIAVLGGDLPSEQLAEVEGWPIVQRAEELADGSLLLERSGGVLQVTWTGPGAPHPISVDLVHGRRPLPRDPLLRAVRPRDAEGTIVDATAGLGLDLATLIGAGFAVLGVERHPLLSALLQDALQRAQAQGAATRASLRAPAEAAAVLATLDPPPAVVFLDPMFPERGKNARTGKQAELLRRLAGPDAGALTDQGRLLEAARETARERVVVKRPLRAPHLPGSRPDGSISGKLLRLDIYGA